MAEILYKLEQSPAQPCSACIQWLNANDYKEFNRHLRLAGQKTHGRRIFKGYYDKGIARYCLLYCDGLPVARGAIEPYSEQAWEAADIRTAREYRNRGFAKEMLLFLSRYILEHGKTATCRTEEHNTAMQKVILSIGYARANGDSR